MYLVANSKEGSSQRGVAEERPEQDITRHPLPLHTSRYTERGRTESEGVCQIILQQTVQPSSGLSVSAMVEHTLAAVERPREEGGAFVGVDDGGVSKFEVGETVVGKVHTGEVGLGTTSHVSYPPPWQSACHKSRDGMVRGGDAPTGQPSPSSPRKPSTDHRRA